MFINIIIKSKNKQSLIKFLTTFKNFINNDKLNLTKTLIFSQQQKINKIFTILKSPHVNKTAQEQFELNLFSKNIKIHSFQIIKILVILKKIQSEFFSDINIQTRFFINQKYKRSLIQTKICSKDLFLNYKKDLKQIKFYLTALNYYGKYSL